MSVSLFYDFWEMFPPMLPDLSAYPLIAALAGGLFVGIGVGLIVRQEVPAAETTPIRISIETVTSVSFY